MQSFVSGVKGARTHLDDAADRLLCGSGRFATRVARAMFRHGQSPRRLPNPMKPPRWVAVSQSAFAWEREALDFARSHLPDHEPWRAWSNFEFIDDEGRVNEVDLLVLTPAGLVLIEIKSRPGTVKGDAQTWIWSTDGRRFTTDNPLPLANRKAKRLSSLLRRQEALTGRTAPRNVVPWIEPLIFLSAITQRLQIDSGSARRVALRGAPGSPDDPGLMGVLLKADELGFARRGPFDATAVRAVTRALDQAGIRQRGRGRMVGDYELTQLMTEGDNWQDFVARHVATGVARRVRIYPYARAATAEARDNLARSAQREFKILEGIEHPGIQRVLDYREAEQGPALVFEHDPASMRLDRYLAEHHQGLSILARLALVRQLGEAMAFAHGKRLFHRGLAPQNILVRNPESDAPRLQITNLQVASRGEGSSPGAVMTAGTQHVEDHLSDPAKIYLAPEAINGGEEAAPQGDVFSLGAIAFHVFTGRPPVENPLDLTARLKEGGGLRLSSALNGVGQWLDELVRAATAPVVSNRLRDAKEFLDYVAEAEVEATPVAPRPALADPATAAPGDELEGGLKVVRRLGRGGSADTLLVERLGVEEQAVLKVAIDDRHADRVRAEAQILARLRHQNIVRFEAEATITGRPAILMEWAGEKTLGQWIRGAETLSLDLMRRFGDHLLSALDYLEQEGVSHRDIKPDNIGVAKAASTGAYRLVLFDFSLSRAPPENIQAGTRTYLDPFLADRRPPRWDLHAERYAAAVTLHEMLTGAPPVYGDGLTDPRATEDEATIAADRFDPALREGLHAFFERAMRRAPAERFGNTEEMLRGWNHAFARLDRGADAVESLEMVARRIHGGSNMAELGFGAEAQDVLRRIGIFSVRQLLGTSRLKFRYLKGVGDKIRREILARGKHLARLRPELVPGAASEDGIGRASIDRLAEQLIARRPAGEEKPEDRILAHYLGIEPEEAPAWPEAGGVARGLAVSRSALADVLEAARERWHKSADLNLLRTELDESIKALGGVATVDELCERLLAIRGSVEEEDGERIRRARAVIRAAVELEVAHSPTRFLAFAEAEPALIAAGPEGAEYARRLGQAADGLARIEPLPSPQRIDEDLGGVALPQGATALPAGRRLRLACAASDCAALSSTMEIYPSGMAAADALRLCLGALAGPRVLTEEELRARVAGRFPAAADLPSRPALDALLDQVEADRKWGEVDGVAGFCSPSLSDSESGTLGGQRLPTFSPPPEPTPDVLSARTLEEKIAHAAHTGAFLALTVAPRRADAAQAELLRRYPRSVVSLERLMLTAMREEAAARRVVWTKVLSADSAARGGADFKNLLRLAARAAPRVIEEVLALREPTLLTRPGLLARYDLVDVLDGLAQKSGAAGGPPSLWLLLPQSAPGQPQIDSVMLPVVSAANWAFLTEAWINNAHRAGQKAA
jgi:serine/threonine protein kinase